MSSQNTIFHKRCGPSMSGGPKPTDMGKDLSRDATNSGAKLQKAPVAPSANANSRNK